MCRATSSTSILVQWQPVRCIHRNSEIAYYLLWIESTFTTEFKNTHDLESELPGLDPHTNYSIKVAAENIHGGIGPFSESTTTATQEDGESVDYSSGTMHAHC